MQDDAAPAEPDSGPGLRSAPPWSAERSPRLLWPLVVALGVLAVVVASLAVSLVVVRAAEQAPRATAGEVFRYPYSEDPLPRRVEVLLPGARFEVAAGRPQPALPDLSGAAPTLAAPEDGSFVRVDVELVDGREVPFPSLATPWTTRTELVLRAGGRDYPLSGTGGIVLDQIGFAERGGSRWVAVEGQPTDLQVLLTVDGVTQVVDAADGSVDAGRAAELADLPTLVELGSAQTRPCGTRERVDDSGLAVSYRPGLQCRIALTLRTPYVDGLGWAAEGREFLVVQVDRPRRLSLELGDGPRWDTTLTFEARLGGAEPLAPETDVDELGGGLGFRGGTADPSQVVFDVARDEPAGDLVLDLIADATLGAPFVTEQRQARFRWTTPGGEVG